MNTIELLHYSIIALYIVAISFAILALIILITLPLTEISSPCKLDGICKGEYSDGSARYECQSGGYICCIRPRECYDCDQECEPTTPLKEILNKVLK